MESWVSGISQSSDNEDAPMFNAPEAGLRSFVQAVVLIAVCAGEPAVALAQGPALLPPAAPPASATPPPVARSAADGSEYFIPQRRTTVRDGAGRLSTGKSASGDPAAVVVQRPGTSAPATALRSPDQNRRGVVDTSRRLTPPLRAIPERQPLPRPRGQFDAPAVQPLLPAPDPGFSAGPVTNPGSNDSVFRTDLQPIPTNEWLPPPRGSQFPNANVPPATTESDWYVPPQNSTSLDQYSETRELPPSHDVLSISVVRSRLDRIIRAVMPSTLSSKQNWGAKKSITTGMTMERKGLFLRPKRTSREVNHGSWQNLSARLKNSKQPYSVQVTGLRKRSAQQATFTATLTTVLRASAEQQEWSRGVKYRTSTAQGVAKVTLRANCTVDWRDVPGTAPQAVRLYPRVDSCTLSVTDWDGDDGSIFTNPGGRALENDLEQMVRNKIAASNRTAKRDLSQHLAGQAMKVHFHELVATRWGAPLARSARYSRQQ